MGTPEFARPSLRAIAHHVVGTVSQPDRPSGRGQKTGPTPVHQEADALHLEHHQTERVSNPETMAWIRSKAPDLIVVVAFGQLLKRELLDLPRFGCVNVHASLLPRWRGASPIVSAILAGDAMTGVCTQRIVEALDAGPVLKSQSLEIAPQDTQATLFESLSHLGAKVLVETIEAIQSAQEMLKGQPQDETKVTLAPKLAGVLLDTLPWLAADTSVVDMDRRVRGFNPWPAAKIQTDQGRIKILKGRPFVGAVETHEQGFLFERRGVLYLGGSDGRYEVQTLQPEGKRALSAGDFLNGLQNKTQGVLPWKVERPRRAVDTLG